MKSFTLGLVVAMGLFGIGCSTETDDQAAAPEPEATRLASSLERSLRAPIAIPEGTPIGTTIDAVIKVQGASLVPEATVVNLGANGRRCTILRFDDAKGVEKMRREQCEKGSDTLRVGSVLYTDQNGDGKIDELSDSTTGTYELYDDDRDGKIDRMVESAERIKTPIALGDFAEGAKIIGGGKIASRVLEDKDHDGKFDFESVTATTSFQVTLTSGARGQAH